MPGKISRVFPCAFSNGLLIKNLSKRDAIWKSMTHEERLDSLATTLVQGNMCKCSF